MTQKKENDLEKLVGIDVYSTWIKMLKSLVPYGRTHRLSVVIASMLEYAHEQCKLKQNLDNPLCQIFEEVVDSCEDFNDELLTLVKSLFEKANVEFERQNSRGQKYCIAESSLQEFFAWTDMPWE